jgi:short subunit dehydrogenase-like uncharacterized protein
VIAVYGAAGAIGRRIAAALVERGAAVRLVGRDRLRLVAAADELGLVPGDVVAAPIHDRAALIAALAGCTAVIGAAGPFARVGPALAAAAVAAEVHYLDVAIEPGFVRALYEEHESAARRSGRCLVSAVGGFGALGDWAADWAVAALAAVDEPVAAIEIAYGFDGAAIAPGMARSLVAALAGPAPRWQRGRWDEVAPTARGKTIDFGDLGLRRARPFATVEAITVPRRHRVERVDTYVAPTGAPWLDRALGAAAPLLRWVPGAAATIDALVDPGRAPPDDAHGLTRFAVVATAHGPRRTATVTASGRDLYAITAAIAARLAHGLASGALDAIGVVTPAELVGGERALGAIADLTIDVALT